MRTTLAAVALALLCTGCFHSPYRRPGLGGQWTKRKMTAPMNSLVALAGPGQPMLMGQRFNETTIEAGAQQTRIEPTGNAPVENQWWMRAGIGFGLTEDLEAGALFLPFQFKPDFDFSSILVFITRNIRLTDDLDIGMRLSFATPGVGGWNFNPGMPVVYRMGPVRLDAGLYVPWEARTWVSGGKGSWWAGFNAPVRATVNLTPNLFAGLDTGYVYPQFSRSDASTVPLGFLLGYSILLGKAVADVTATFTWDNFAQPGAPDDALRTDLYRVQFGVTMHRLVK